LTPSLLPCAIVRRRARTRRTSRATPGPVGLAGAPPNLGPRCRRALLRTLAGRSGSRRCRARDYVPKHVELVRTRRGRAHQDAPGQAR
jgi:hypothetical protein